MKYIPFIILAAVLAAFDYYTLSGLGHVTESYRADTITGFFTGSVLDWISFALFNGAIVSYAIALWNDRSILSNEVGSSAWNYFLAGALAAAVLLTYLG